MPKLFFYDGKVTERKPLTKDVKKWSTQKIDSNHELLLFNYPVFFINLNRGNDSDYNNSLTTLLPNPKYNIFLVKNKDSGIFRKS